MNPSQIYIAISIVVLAIIALLVFFVRKNKKEKKLTPLAGLSFGLILAGIIYISTNFGDSRLVYYGLMGAAVVLAVIDIVLKLKKK